MSVVAKFQRQALSLLMLCCIFLTPSNKGHSQDLDNTKDWKAVYSYKNLKVYKYKKPSSFVGIRGVAQLDKPLKVIYSVLFDTAQWKSWVPLLKRGKLLQKVSNYKYFFYQSYRMPRAISDRDFVYVTKVIKSHRGKVTIKNISAVHKSAPKTVGVRGYIKDNTWILTPLKNGKTKVDMRLRGSLKGSLPKWGASYLKEKYIYMIFKNLRKAVKNPKIKMIPQPSQNSL